MKRHSLIIGIIGILLVFGLVLTGCDTPTTNTNRTGISNPDNLRITNTTATSITLAWNSVQGATKYGIWCTPGNINTPLNQTAHFVANTTSTTFTVTGLTPNTSYKFGVDASNAYAESANWTTIAGTTLSGSSGTIAKPTNLRTTGQTTTSITLAWNPVSGAAGYGIWCSTSSSIHETSDFVEDIFDGRTTYTVEGLSPNTTYWFVIDAFINENISSGWTTAISVSTLGSGPSAPTGLYASVTSASTMTVHWTSVSGATGYYVYWSADDVNYTKIANLMTSSSSDIFNLFPLSKYYFKVTAANSSGESPMSSSCSATTYDADQVYMNLTSPTATLTANKRTVWFKFTSYTNAQITGYDKYSYSYLYTARIACDFYKLVDGKLVIEKDEVSGAELRDVDFGPYNINGTPWEGTYYICIKPLYDSDTNLGTFAVKLEPFTPPSPSANQKQATWIRENPKK